MAFVNINDVNIFYEIHGDGDVIVLLHHGFGCSKMWKDIYPNIVAKGYKVIMYDRRGYGQSERGPDFKEYYVDNNFRTASIKELAILMKIINIDSFHLIGQCEGGVIAVDYAAKYPDQIKTITTSSTQCYNKLSMPEFNKLKFEKPFQDLEPEVKQKLIYWHGNDYAETSYDLYRKYGGAYGKGFFDLRDLLPSVICPALVLYPDRSSIFDVEQAVAFYRHLPKGELAVLPNCGHNTYDNQPEEYNRLILNFLKRHDETVD